MGVTMEKRILIRPTDVTAFRLRCNNEKCRTELHYPASSQSLEYPSQCHNCNARFYPTNANPMDKAEHNVLHHFRNLLQRDTTSDVNVELIIEVEGD